MADDDGGLDAVFQALMHATRRDMLARLTDGALSVGELAAPLPVSLAAASKHVQVLERAGLITRTVVGRRHEFRVAPATLAGATHWLTEHAATAEPPVDDSEHVTAKKKAEKPEVDKSEAKKKPKKSEAKAKTKTRPKAKAKNKLKKRKRTS